MVNVSTTRRLNDYVSQRGAEVRSTHCHGFVTDLAANPDGEN
jgi:hypothetical protein